MRWITAANTRRERLYIPLVRRDKNIYRLRGIHLYDKHMRCLALHFTI